METSDNARVLPKLLDSSSATILTKRPCANRREGRANSALTHERLLGVFELERSWRSVRRVDSRMRLEIIRRHAARKVRLELRDAILGQGQELELDAVLILWDG